MKHSLVSAFFLACSVSALHLPFTRRATSETNSIVLIEPSTLTNSKNEVYTSTITVNGRKVPVVLDTGSTDFWLYEYTSGLLDTATKVNPPLDLVLSYGIGNATGYVAQIDVEFAGFHVANQSFLYVQEYHDIDLNVTAAGVLGLGFDTISEINTVVSTNFSGETWGRSLLSNIFASDPSISNHIAFRLDRFYDGSGIDRGFFDIGTFALGFGAVNDTAEIPIFSTDPEAKKYWSVLVDGFTINGGNQTLQTSIAQGTTPPTGKLAAVLDTGFSLAQVPHELAKAIYEPMGGVYAEDLANYVVPCEAQANLTVHIGGHAVPIHPLDITFPMPHQINGRNMTVCVGGFQPFSSNAGIESVDMILGDTFLRNTYTVYGFGDFVNGTSGRSQNSYIKLLPLTDPATASAEFASARKTYLTTLPPQLDVSTYASGKPQTIPGTGTPVASNGATRSGMSMELAGLTVALVVLGLV